MYKPAGLTKLNQTTLKKNTKIPSSINAFFFTLQICFGINFGFIKVLNEKIQPVAKCLSILISVTILILLIMPLNNVRRDGDMMIIYYSIVQYIIYFLVLNFTKHSFFDFLVNVTLLNEYVPQIKQEIIGYMAFGYTFIIFFVKFVLGYHFCKNFGLCIGADAPFYIYVPAVLSLDLISVVLIFIYYYIFCCVKTLKERILEAKINIKPLHTFYLQLAECYDIVMPLYDNILAVELLFELPKLLMALWSLCLFSTQQMDVLGYANQIVHIIHVMVRIIVPAIITEYANAQVEAAKLALHYKLFTEDDEKTNKEILRLLRYMEARRLQHKVWRVIPVDLQLPLTVFSMCITYLIVIVQFTHLYD